MNNQQSNDDLIQKILQTQLSSAETLSTMRIVDRIEALIEKQTLLGAAYDCMSDIAKRKFHENLLYIVRTANEPKS